MIRKKETSTNIHREEKTETEYQSKCLKEHRYLCVLIGHNNNSNALDIMNW